MKSEDWKPPIRALIYPVQFEADLLKHVDFVVKSVMQDRVLETSPERYLASIRTALSSQVRLSELIPQPHSEEKIRRFLSEVEKRLAARLEEGQS